MLDIVKVKKAIKDGEVEAYVKDNIIYLTYCETEETVMIGEIKPKTGQWEWITEDKYRCSNCGHETRIDTVMNVPQYKFCPYCSERKEKVKL